MLRLNATSKFCFVTTLCQYRMTLLTVRVVLNTPLDRIQHCIDIRSYFVFYLELKTILIVKLYRFTIDEDLELSLVI